MRTISNDAMTELNEYTTGSLDQNNKSRAIFLALAKNIDTVLSGTGILWYYPESKCIKNYLKKSAYI